MIWNRLSFGPITKGNHVEHTITTSMLQLMHFCCRFASQCFRPLRANWRSEGARKGWRGAELGGTEQAEGVRRPTEEGGLKVRRRKKKRGRLSRCSSSGGGGGGTEGARCGGSHGGNKRADGEQFHSEAKGPPECRGVKIIITLH